VVVVSVGTSLLVCDYAKGAFGKYCQTDLYRMVCRPSVRKVVSDRSDCSAHFRTSAARDGGDFKLLHTFLEIRMTSSATFVYVKRYKYRTVSVRRPIKMTNRTNAFSNAMGAIRPNSAHVPTIYRTRFSAV
jgi:hypothetical protein